MCDKKKVQEQMGKILLGISIGLLAGGIIAFVALSYIDLTAPFSWVVFFFSATIVGAIVEMILRTKKCEENTSAPDSDIHP